MCRRFPFLPVILLAILTYTAPHCQAAGIRFSHTDSFVLEHGELLSQELWLVADNVHTEGIVEENFFILGGDALLSGVFRKDIWALARGIDFGGHINGSARLAARGPVNIEGLIDSSIMAASTGPIQLGNDASIGHDALLMGQSVMARGSIGGHLRIMAAQTTLGGDIGGSVRIRADDIVILPGTRIGGDLIYTAPREIELDRHVQLGGELIRMEPEPGLFDVTWTGTLMIRGFLFLAAMLVGAPFAAAFPRYTGRAVRQVRRSFWKCSLTGAIAFFMIPMLAAIAMITLIGIPLGLVMISGYLVFLYISKIIVGVAIGGILLNRRGRQSFPAVLMSMAIGLLLLYIAISLPIVGHMVMIVTGFLGLGGLILGMSGSSTEPPPINKETFKTMRDS